MQVVQFASLCIWWCPAASTRPCRVPSLPPGSLPAALPVPATFLRVHGIQIPVQCPSHPRRVPAASLPRPCRVPAASLPRPVPSLSLPYPRHIPSPSPADPVPTPPCLDAHPSHPLLGPVDVSLSALHSLSQNALCGLDEYGNGTYTAEGVIQIVEALKVNQTLQSIKYAAELNQSIIQPGITSGPTDATTLRVLSLSNNALCGLSELTLGGQTCVIGTYTAEGIIQIAEALKVNKTLQSIEYA
eukprot:6069638-Prymnesium_polylepis.2